MEAFIIFLKEFVKYLSIAIFRPRPNRLYKGSGVIFFPLKVKILRPNL